MKPGMELHGGTRSIQIEKSKEDVDVDSCREERSLKAKGSLGFREGESIGSGKWHGMERS